MRIYIAGPITNNPNYDEDFKKAEDLIKSAGHRPFNPVLPWGSSYKFYIDRGLQELSKCDAILLIGDISQSKGAKLEMLYALTVGLEILDGTDPDIINTLRNLK